MTRGFLVFAHNNEHISYGLLAVSQAEQIKKILNKPVTVVLDQATATDLDNLRPNWKSCFDQVVYLESVATQTKRYGAGKNQLTFHNLDRSDAWDITPYDETILIDTDILIQTENLNKLWGTSEDLLVCDKSTNLYGNKLSEFTWISDRSIKFYWATICYFKKTEVTELFFKQCKWVKENYSWLAHVHEIPANPLRNDFVWSIALHSLGHPAATIPFNLLYSTYDDQLIKTTDHYVAFLTANGVCKISHDVHMFNKYDLIKLINQELV